MTLPCEYVQPTGPEVAPESTLPDSIRHAVMRLGGKTMMIRSPGELAKAIDRLEQTVSPKHASN
jgi:hypothetical protein